MRLSTLECHSVQLAILFADLRHLPGNFTVAVLQWRLCIGRFTVVALVSSNYKVEKDARQRERNVTESLRALTDRPAGALNNKMKS